MLANLDDLEKKLEQCRLTIFEVLNDIDIIQREINEAKQNDGVHTIDEQPQKKDITDKSPIAEQLINEDVPDVKIIYHEGDIQPKAQENSVTETVYYYQAKENKVKENKAADNNSESAESVLGKKVMAVAASILIFLSLILFATVIIPKLSDQAKFILMLLVSIGITVFGLAKWFKDKESVLFLSIGACGVGAVYISIFLCNLYFKMIGDVALFALLLVWSFGVLLLSKYKKLVFMIIGSAGVTISVFVGCQVCLDNSDLDKFIILLIYSIIGVISYLLLCKKDNTIYVVNNTFAFCCISMLTVCLNKLKTYNLFIGVDSSIIISAVILSVCSIGLIIYNRLITNKTNCNWMGLFGISINYCLIWCLKTLIIESDIYHIIIIIVSIIMIVAIELHIRVFLKMPKSIPDIIWIVLLYLFITIYMLIQNTINPGIGIAVLSLAMYSYGFIVNDILYKTLGLIAYAFVLTQLNDKPVVLLITCIVLFALENALMFIKKDQYNNVIKYVLYILFLTGISEFLFLMVVNNRLGIQTACTVLVVVLGLLNLIAQKTYYSKNWETFEEEKYSELIHYIVNTILMLVSLFVISYNANELEHWIAILIGILLFTVNSKKLIMKNDPYVSLYVGFKSTVLFVVILVSFKATGTLLSILVFLLAIAFIVLGFVLKNKGLRIYGLIVSLVCVVKLSLVDITYQNTIGHAISFFICGVLCFSISAIYSYVEKKYK